MDCNNCNKVVPYIVHEADMARQERTIQRLWTTIIILIATMVCMFVGFFIYESQYEDVSVTQENDTGYNNFIGNDGDIVNGEISYGEADNQNP